ncbi:MAG: DUF885 domain-containing protein [Candidatus Aminicenantes bacterium]|nr:MAG: DUF885 domain-containing protein [Candidatus Aminicenantes bacterium]
MKSTIYILIFVFLIVRANGSISKPLEAVETTASNSTKILKEVTSQYWQLLLENSVYLRQRQGLEIKRLPEFSLKKAESDTRQVRSLLQKLKEVKPDEISYDQRLTFQILEWQMENQIKGHGFFWFNFPTSTYGSPIPYINRLFSHFRFREQKHLRQYLHLLNQYPVFIEEIIAHLKQQCQKKIIPPQAALKSSISYLRSLIQPADKGFFHVRENRLKPLLQTQTQIAEFQKKVSRVVTLHINPALEKLVTFVREDYFKHAPEPVGLWQYPQGKDYYRFLVKINTTLDLTPEEIHQIGLKEIENLRKKLDDLRKELNFKGDVDAFVRFLKTDPRFRPQSPEDIGKRLTHFKEQAEAKLPIFFSKLPKAPCGVKRLNPLLEPSMTYGYYQTPLASDPKGYYLYNASNLEKKNILNTASAALILHELLPGHHFQVALQAENETLSPFRRELFLTSYSEGWAEYAAQLGNEMGTYKDPYERCGRIMQDLFMSVRLVVDTGMNYFQWPRSKAMKFMRKYLLLSDVEIETETLRYSTGIPGHALGYKIGSLKISQLREKAEKALGPKFDLRKFHDAILGKGTLPLFLLEKHVERFISSFCPARVGSARTIQWLPGGRAGKGIRKRPVKYPPPVP